MAKVGSVKNRTRRMILTAAKSSSIGKPHSVCVIFFVTGDVVSKVLSCYPDGNIHPLTQGIFD